MGVREEMLELLQKVSNKLLELPQANVLEKRAFVVLVLFVVLLVFMIMVPCVYSFCYQERTKAEAAQAAQAAQAANQAAQPSEEIETDSKTIQVS